MKARYHDRATQRSAAPMYRKIEAMLRDQIFSGELTSGDKVPTEEALRKIFGASRPTVRHALQILEQENLIIRQAGRGTYVNEIAAELPSRRRSITLDNLANLQLDGTKLTLQRQGVLAARGEVQTALKVPFGEEIFYFIRVHREGGRPLAGAKVYLPLAHGRRLRKQDMLAATFLRALACRLDTRIMSIASRAEAMLADARTGELFETPVGSPLLSIRRVSYDSKGQPVEHSHILIRSDVCQITFDQRAQNGAGGWPCGPVTQSKVR